MRSIHLLIAALLLLSGASTARGQRQSAVWFFGDHAGLDFNSGVPVPIDGGMTEQWEGTASMADRATGALLFYTDGVTVWNRNHRPMPNGTGLNGNWSSTQSALIVPMPCDPNRYYLFTSDADDVVPSNVGVQYAIVDMTADGGLGDITTRNIPLLDPATEKLTAVRHTNGRDFWVIAHARQGHAFHVWLVSDVGIAATPVISSLGADHTGNAIGYLKASPDGRRLASVLTGSTAELFDFDPSTGAVSNPLRLSESAYYGLSFSPDNSKLYVVEEDTILYQYNLSDPSHAAILASRTAVGTGRLLALQLAPDGKIYAATYLSRLAVITNPNGAGTTCGFLYDGPSLATASATPYSRQGLPNFIESLVEGRISACGPPTADFTVSSGAICQGECVTLRDASTDVPASWEWTMTGASIETTRQQHPGEICYAAPGVYTVRLIVANEAGSDTAEKIVTVVPRMELQARTERRIEVAPGDTLAIPISLDGTIATPLGDTLLLTIRYGAGAIRPVDLRAAAALAGWQLEITDTTAGFFGARLLPPQGGGIAAPGLLLDVRFIAFIGSADTSPVRVSLVAPGLDCVTIAEDSGMVDVNLCGIAHRLVEPFSAKYRLDGNSPNPFNPRTTITFSLGLDGYTRVEIFDALGRRVDVLRDGHLPAGEHAVVWDASPFPSGVYRCRIRSGAWEAIRSMTLVK